MEPSSSQPPKFDPEKNNLPSGQNGSSGKNGANDPSGRRMVADHLMAALASGNLENLAHARQAFLNEGHAAPSQPRADLEAQLERRTKARSLEQSFAPADDPQVVVVVLVERGGKGGQVAAPIARQIYQTIFLERVAMVTLGAGG